MPPFTVRGQGRAARARAGGVEGHRTALCEGPFAAVVSGASYGFSGRKRATRVSRARRRPAPGARRGRKRRSAPSRGTSHPCPPQTDVISWRSTGVRGAGRGGLTEGGDTGDVGGGLRGGRQVWGRGTGGGGGCGPAATCR